MEVKPIFPSGRCKIALLAEAPGEQEDILGVPVVGEAGQELYRMCLQAGIVHQPQSRYTSPLQQAELWEESGLMITNVFSRRPPNNDLSSWCVKREEVQPLIKEGLYPHTAINTGEYLHPSFLWELDRLREELKVGNPNIVIAMGNKALWAMCNVIGITAARGRIATATGHIWGGKVLPTFHPADVLRTWSHRPWTVLDLIKAERQSNYPEIRLPRRRLLIRPTIGEIRRWFNKVTPKSLLSFDTETKPKRRIITCISFSIKADEAIIVPFVSQSTPGYSYWSSAKDELTVWEIIRKALEGPCHKIAQNGLYDMQWLWEQAGIKVHNCTEDTMVLHHALEPEVKKDLGSLGSVYTEEAAWKLMRPRGYENTKGEE